MDMGMKMQVLAPGVENSCMSCSCTEILFVSGQFLYGFCHAAKQQVVTRPLVAVDMCVQLIWHSEHDMKIAYIQQIGFLGIHPALFCERLTFGTVSVSAGIIGRPLVAARRAFIQVAAKSGCSTVEDVIHRFTLDHGKRMEGRLK